MGAVGIHVKSSHFPNWGTGNQDNNSASNAGAVYIY